MFSIFCRLWCGRTYSGIFLIENREMNAPLLRHLKAEFGMNGKSTTHILKELSLHAGHHDPRVHQGHSAGGMAHCAVQSAGQMGLRPRAAARPLAKPGPEFTARKAVLHTAQAKGGKIEVFCAERSRVFKVYCFLQNASPPGMYSFARTKEYQKSARYFRSAGGTN